MRGGGEDPTLVGVFYIALCAISALAIMFAPESFRKKLDLTTPPKSPATEEQSGQSAARTGTA